MSTTESSNRSRQDRHRLKSIQNAERAPGTLDCHRDISRNRRGRFIVKSVTHYLVPWRILMLSCDI